jgi:hypothetical protein
MQSNDHQGLMTKPVQIAHPFSPDGRDLAETFGISVTPVADTRTSVVHLGSDDLVYFRYRPGAKETIDDLEEYFGQMRASLGPKNRKYGILVDLTNLGAMTKEARVAHAKPESTEFASIIAIVARSRLMRTIGNFFIFLDQPTVPTRLFATVTEARSWLLERKEATRVG